MKEDNKNMEQNRSNGDLMSKIISQAARSSSSGYPGDNKQTEKRSYQKTPLLGVDISLKDSGLLSEPKKEKTLKLKGLKEEQRSDLVKEVLESPPNSLIRWGSSWTLLIMLMLLGISWYVQYPDLVKGAMQVTSNNEATAIAARADGILEELLVKDGDTVKTDQLLGRLESMANPSSIERLDDFLHDLDSKLSSNPDYSLSRINLPSFPDLGQLQQPFQNFAKLFISSKQFGSTGLASQKVDILNNDLRELNEQMSNLQVQQNNYEVDYNLAFEEYQNKKEMQKRGLISENILRDAESKVLSKKQIINQNNAMFNSNRLQKNQKMQEILELERNGVEYASQLKQEVGALILAIDNWEKQTYIKSLTDGKLMFNKKIQENQQVRNGQPLFYILPENASWYGQMAVGQYNIGKVKKGQRVILKFEGYPYQEFGTMDAEITSVSQIPVDSSYIVKVKLPDNLETNSHKKLQIRSGMMASGEIVTEDMRLLEKVFYEVRRYLKQ